MSIFFNKDFDDHELIMHCFDRSSSLKAIIAIHNTNRGPALGGCRFWNYTNEEEALTDVLRLSRGMTYKSSLANLNLGGGKAVIIGDSKTEKTPEKMRSLGRFIEKLNGAYITAEDVGTSTEDMAEVLKETKHVVGLANIAGGSGDPSRITAYGVFKGIKAAAKYKFGTDNLKDMRIAIQGLGHVGMNLAEFLYLDGAVLHVTDINQDNLRLAKEKFNATTVSPNEILSLKVDILAPCALGGIINDTSVDKFQCKIIAGAANNQLAESRHGILLKERDILYAPDYLINAGGLINVTHEGSNYNKEKVMSLVDGIYHTLLEILELAKKKDIPTNQASDEVAESRFKVSKKDNTQNRRLA